VAPSVQAKLLRALQEREIRRVGGERTIKVNTRVVAATNRDLEALVREGRIRQDFLYRLNVVEVRLPALRERRSDLPLLIRHFLARFGDGKRLSAEAEARLLAYDWPGNIRELQNALQRAALLSEGPEIEARHFPEALLGEPPQSAEAGGFREAKQRVVERFEREYLSRCLREAAGNISQVARAAGIDYKNFYTKMQQLGIDPAGFRG
jgi:two-component system response regulator AtoC